MLEREENVHNLSKKIAQLNKIIERSLAMIDERKLKVSFLEENVDKEFQKIYQNYQSEINRLQTDMNKIDDEANKTYKMLFDSKFDNLQKLQKSDVNSIINHTKNVIKDTEAKLEEYKKIVPSLALNFDKENENLDKEIKTFKQELEIKISEMSKENEFNKKKADQETNKKIENYLKESTLRCEQIQRNFDVMKNRPNTAASNSRKSTVGKGIKKQFDKISEEVAQQKQTASNMHAVHETTLTSYKEKVKGILSQFKILNESNLKTIDSLKNSLANEEAVFRQKKQALLDKRNEMEENYHKLETDLFNKQTEESKKFRESQESYVKTGFIRSQSSDFFFDSFTATNEKKIEKLEEKCKIEKEEEEKILKLLTDQRDKALESTKKEKEAVDKELAEIEAAKKEFQETQKENSQKEIDELNKEYQHEIIKINQRFDAIKVKNSQLLPAAKKLSTMQDELTTIKNAHAKALTNIDSIYQTKEERLIPELEVMRKQAIEADEKEMQMKQNAAAEKIKKEEEEIAAFLEKFKLNVNINNKIEFDQSNVNYDGVFNFSKYEELILKLRNELNSITVPQPLPEDKNVSEFEQKKETILKKSEQNQSKLIKVKQDAYQIEVNKRKTIDADHNSKKNVMHKQKDALIIQHEETMKKLIEREKNAKNLLDELNSMDRISETPFVPMKEVDDLRGKLHMERNMSMQLLNTQDIFLSEARQSLLEEIAKAKKANRQLIEEEDAKFEVIHNDFKEKLKSELKRRDELREFSEKAFSDITKQCNERTAKKASEYQNEIKAIKAQIQTFAVQHADMPIQRKTTFERRKASLETRNDEYVKQYEEEINILKERRKKAVDEISLSAADANKRLEDTKKKVALRPPRPEEQIIIKNLEDRLNELNQNLIEIGRSMLAYHDVLGIRESNYSQRFSQTVRATSALKGKNRRFSPLPPLDASL